jgi:hypothetical protein
MVDYGSAILCGRTLYLLGGRVSLTSRRMGEHLILNVFWRAALCVAFTTIRTSDMAKQPAHITGDTAPHLPLPISGPISLTETQIDEVSGGMMPLVVIGIAIGCALLLAHD